MNNLLFYAILIALIYYFFFYLPQTKKLANLPLKQNRTTQTEELERIITDYEPEAIKCPGPQMVENTKELEKLKKDNQQKEQTIIGLNNSYEKLETKSKQELDNLKQQLQGQETKLKEILETEKVLNNLIKGIQDLNKELN